jgi:hypothetical protein
VEELDPLLGPQIVHHQIRQMIDFRVREPHEKRLQYNLPLTSELLLDHLEHLAILDVGAPHLFRVLGQNLANFIVQPVFDLELSRHDIHERLDHPPGLVDLDESSFL